MYQHAHTTLICTSMPQHTHMYQHAHSTLICTFMHTPHSNVPACTQHTHMYQHAHTTLKCTSMQTAHSYVPACTHHTHMYQHAHTTLICTSMHTALSYVPTCTQLTVSVSSTCTLHMYDVHSYSLFPGIHPGIHPQRGNWLLRIIVYTLYMTSGTSTHSVESLQDISGGKVQLIQDHPVALPHRLHQYTCTHTHAHARNITPLIALHCMTSVAPKPSTKSLEYMPFTTVKSLSLNHQTYNYKIVCQT